MDSAYPRWDISQVKVIPALSAGCSCGASLTRADTGMCERCTAKKPEQVARAEEWRQKCLRTVPRVFSAPLASDACSVCGQTYDGLWRSHRIFECEARPCVCERCDHRFDTLWELTRHQRDAHGVSADR